MQKQLIQQIVELGLSTTHQARIIKADLWRVKAISQGRGCKPLSDKQAAKLEAIKGVLG